jgi:serine/threonine protein kinase
MELLNKTIGKYKLTHFIGEGGMASVYEGTHEKLGTKVAIKILNPILTANKQIRQRFENEAKFMASLEHPNITRVIDFDEQTDTLAIVMELLTGQDLSTLIKTKGALKPEQAIPLFTQILDAFQYAHNKGIVHRDIKPSNIFINEDNQVKILDFGIAKIFGTEDDFTSTGQQIGTPVYMSPEQVKADKSIDHRSDIYSLGVTLYFTLNGKPPYDSTTHSNFEIFNKIVFEPIPDLEQYPEINKVLKTAVNKDRDQRFQSSKAFKDALLSGNIQSKPNETDDKTLVFGYSDQSDDKTLIDDQKAAVNTTIEKKQDIKIVKHENQTVRIKHQPKNKTIRKIKPIVLAGIGTIALIISIFLWQPWINKEKTAWQNAVAQNSIDSYNKYISLYPDGRYISIANDSVNHKSEYQSFNTTLSTNTTESYLDFLQKYPESQFKSRINDSIASIKKNDSIKAVKAFNTTPEGKAELLVLGKHPLTLHWVSEDYAGSINIKKENGVISVNGIQNGKESKSGDYVKINGTLSIVNENHLKIKGTIETKVSFIKRGEPCLRKGEFNFQATSGRKYWRMQEWFNPCDGLTDYVDIYFKQL